MSAEPNIEWSNELILEYLSIYEKHPVIWDPKNLNHKSRSHVIHAWNCIKHELSIKVTVEHLKKKKESLMATYRLLKRKMAESAKSGAATGNVYKPSWFAFSKMDQFLGDTFKSNITTNTINTDATLTDPLSSCVGNDSTDNSRDTFEGIALENEYSDSGSHNYDYTPQFTKPEESKPKKRKILSNQEEFDDCMTQLCESSQQTINPDELSLYGELLMRKLRGLSLRTRKIVMNRIDNIVFQAELKELEQQTDTPVPSVQSICKASPPSCSGFDI